MFATLFVSVGKKIRSLPFCLFIPSPLGRFFSSSVLVVFLRAFRLNVQNVFLLHEKMSGFSRYVVEWLESSRDCGRMLVSLRRLNPSIIYHFAGIALREMLQTKKLLFIPFL